MTSNFSVTIADLVDDDPARNIASIKDAVINQLRASDEGVAIEKTEYFNHTYAPDLVLHWGAGRMDRRVYLRTNSNPAYLLQDVSVVSVDKPILMPLSPVRAFAEADSRLNMESASSQTLVADPSTFEALGEEQEYRPIGQLLSRAVLQGGRGLLDDNQARSAGGTMNRAFAGAQLAEASVTREAIDTAEALLDPVHAEQITRLFHALWLGSGAPATAFPGATSLAATLDATSLQLLLDVAVSDDDQFWRRIGSGLTLERLCEVTVSAKSENLQRLINVNIDQLRVKVCQVSDRGDRNSEQSGLRWFVDDDLLGLDGLTFQAYFSAGNASEVRFPETYDGPGIGIRELLARARQGNIEIGALEFEAAGGRFVDYKSITGADVADDDLLQSIGSALGSRLTVRMAAVLLGGGARQLRCDFKAGTASGRTGAKFYLSEMLSGAIPILKSLAPGERRTLEELIVNAAPRAIEE